MLITIVSEKQGDWLIASLICSEASTSFLPSWWHLLEASGGAFDPHNTATTTWGAFSVIFSHHFSGPQTSSPVSTTPTSSVFLFVDLTDRALLQASHKRLPLLWAYHLRIFLWLRPRKRQEVTVIRPILSAIGYLHQHAPPPPPSLHPLHRPENFLYRSNNPDSDIAWHASPHPFPTLDPPLLIFHRARLLHSPDEQPTSFASSCGYISLEAIRNTGHRESHRHLVDRYDRFRRIHKQNTITLYLHSHHRLRSLLWLPFYSTALAQHNVNPKIDFQSSYWNPISDYAKSFIRRLAALDPLHRPTF